MPPGPPPPADQPATAIQIAARLLADGEVGEAAHRLEAIVQAAPAYPAAQVLLAKAYEAAERWEEALGAWHQAYFLVPGSPLVRRERQRLLDAQVRAALPAEWAREAPEAEGPVSEPAAEPARPDEPPAAEAEEPPVEAEEPPVEVEEPPLAEAPAASLAAEPGGGLPDAHQALASDTEVALEDEGRREPPAEEAPELEPLEDADELLVLDEPEVAERAVPEAAEPSAPVAEPESEPADEPEAEDVAETFDEGGDAVAEAEPTVEPASEPEEFDAFGDDEEADDLWVAPGPAVSRALDEPSIAPPDLDEEPSEPIAESAGGEAAWWQRPAAPEPEEDGEEPEAGWAIVEETEAGAPTEGPIEARIASPDEALPEPDTPGEEPVEDAQVVNGDAEPGGEARSADDAPEAPPSEQQSSDSDVADELDALIQQLEDAPRIRPDPTFRGPDVVVEEDEADDMVSETLARIYVSQRQYAEAAAVYEKLAEQKPEQAEEMRRRAAELRAQSGEA